MSTDLVGNVGSKTVHYSVSDGPTISIGSASFVEGNSGDPGLMRLPVSLSSPAKSRVTVRYATVPGTATAPSDYTSSSGSVTFQRGETSHEVRIPTRADKAVEGDELFTVELGQSTGAAVRRSTGFVTILDDDPSTGRRVSVGDASVVEGDSGIRYLTFNVTSSTNAPQSGLRIAYEVTGLTADPDSDFTPRAGTVTIQYARRRAIVRIPIRGDVIPESDETVQIRLVSVIGGRTPVIARGTGVGTIVDDDGPVAG